MKTIEQAQADIADLRKARNELIADYLELKHALEPLGYFINGQGDNDPAWRDLMNLKARLREYDRDLEGAHAVLDHMLETAYEVAAE